MNLRQVSPLCKSMGWKRDLKLPEECPWCLSKTGVFRWLNHPGQVGCYDCHEHWEEPDLMVPMFLRNPEAA